MVFSKALSEQELAEALKLVQHCFEAGDGVCQRRLHPEELAVPEEWLEDVDAWFEELADKNHDLRR